MRLICKDKLLQYLTYEPHKFLYDYKQVLLPLFNLYCSKVYKSYIAVFQNSDDFFCTITRKHLQLQYTRDVYIPVLINHQGADHISIDIPSYQSYDHIHTCDDIHMPSIMSTPDTGYSKHNKCHYYLSTYVILFLINLSFYSVNELPKVL